MPAVRLTESNVKYLKSKIKDIHPNLKSSHASELIANILGFKTNIALKTAIRHDEHSFQRIVHVTPEQYDARKDKIGFPAVDFTKIYDLTKTWEFPDPIWKEIKDPYSLESRAWYKYCNSKNIPYVYIKKEDGGYHVSYDAITVDPPFDAPLVGEKGNNIGQIIYNLAEAVGKFAKSYWEFDGTCFVGDVRKMNKKAALHFADAVFEIQHSITQKERLTELG